MRKRCAGACPAARTSRALPQARPPAPPHPPVAGGAVRVRDVPQEQLICCAAVHRFLAHAVHLGGRSRRGRRSWVRRHSRQKMLERSQLPAELISRQVAPPYLQHSRSD